MNDKDKAMDAAEREMPTLPKSLLNLIGEYGMARTDGVGELEVQHRWLSLIAGIKEYARSVLTASEAPGMPEGWHRITKPGQVKVGTKLRFTIGDEKYSGTAKLILHPGTDREEIIYNKRQNYYLITSMCIENKGSQKNVEFLRAAPSSPALDAAKVRDAEERAMMLNLLERIQKFHGTTSLFLVIENYGSREAGAAEGRKLWNEDVPSMVARLKSAPSQQAQQDGWVSVETAMPKHGQMIRGRSDAGEWVEKWDESEPIGSMTHWKPFPPVSAGKEQA